MGPLLTELMKLPVKVREQIVAETLTPEQAEALLYDWTEWGRESQQIPEGMWIVWLILAGRGWGKTRTGAQTCHHWVDVAWPHRIRIAGIAETNRAPFDFPEAEQELVAGYHTEYSSMAFAMFFLAEYINMITVSAVATNLFLGGWHGPFLPPEYGWIWFVIKLAVLLFIYLWLRWTLPRFRYDQLMSFGWKVLLPLATINLLATAAGVLYFGL